MKRPGMRWSATPTLNAGASCGASSDDGTADDDVVGVSAHAASTPATAKADASRLMVVRDIDESSLGTCYTSSRSRGRKNARRLTGPASRRGRGPDVKTSSRTVVLRGG